MNFSNASPLFTHLLFGVVMISTSVFGQQQTTAEKTTALLSHLDLDRPGLEDVKKASDNPNVAAKALLDYYRARTSVKHPVDRTMKKSSPGQYATPAVVEMADNALKHIFIGQPAYPPHFCGDDINWSRSPVADNEWIWQLHRMYFWDALAKAYWHTGDEKYAAAWVFQLDDWAKKNPRDKNHEYAWRSIEAGIRGHAWTGLYQHFIDSPAVTPEFLITFMEACRQHAVYLLGVYSRNNWGLMEAEGLAHIALLFPEFKDAEKWRGEAVKRLNEQVNIQVYPDGHHNELSISYHLICVDFFARTLALAQMNGLAEAFPESYRERIEKMCEVLVFLGMPDGANTQFGDAWKENPGINWPRIKPWAAQHNRPDFLHVATEGKEGVKPAQTAFAFPNSGFYSMRSGWDKNDICLILKCGPDGGGHCHPDNGTFELYAGGRHLMPDSGCYIYSGGDRDWFRQTKVHQTLTLDGRNSAYAPKLLLWQPGEDLDVLVVENKSYPGLTHRRAVLFVDKQFFILVDEAIGDATGDLDLHFQFTPGEAEFDTKDASERLTFHDGKNVQTRSIAPVFDAQNLTARTGFENGWNVFVKNVLPAGATLLEEEGQVSFVYTKKEPRPAFCYRIPKTTEAGVRFVTVVAPYTGKLPEIKAEVLGSPVVGGDKVELRITANGKSTLVGYDLAR